MAFIRKKCVPKTIKLSEIVATQKTIFLIIQKLTLLYINMQYSISYKAISLKSCVTRVTVSLLVFCEDVSVAFSFEVYILYLSGSMSFGILLIIG